ncbi:MAG: ABC transporter substrate-binding protein [Desulfobulbaceae bacterium]|nr:ABC transporter substrate-binding protein [Desulfobulbaceae bacterium]
MHLPTLLATLLLLLSTPMITGCDSDTAPRRQYRVGIINPSSGLNEVVEGFKQGLAEQGFKNGDNLSYIDYGPVKMNEVANSVKNMLAQNIDLLYTTSTRATQIAKQTTEGTDVAIVFAPVFAPEKTGIVDSLPRPGGNVTGVKVGGSSGNTFHWLMSALPGTKHVFVPYHCTDPAAQLCFTDMSLAAQRAGVAVDVANVTNKAELEAALANIPAHTDAIWLSCSPLIFSNIDEIVAAATARKLPVASTTHQQEEGVMLSYGVNNIALGKQASRIAAQILRGAAPAEIPVETAEFFLSINLAIADQLGIEIPTHVLQQANNITREEVAPKQDRPAP